MQLAPRGRRTEPGKGCRDRRGSGLRSVMQESCQARRRVGVSRMGGNVEKVRDREWEGATGLGCAWTGFFGPRSWQKRLEVGICLARLPGEHLSLLDHTPQCLRGSAPSRQQPLHFTEGQTEAQGGTVTTYHLCEGHDQERTQAGVCPTPPTTPGVQALICNFLGFPLFQY